jgi:uncharacterized protein YutE (UPF0331/DUF86 family)
MMNERIRKLAEQAGIYKLNLSDETEYWIMEKFAQLIVQQCADIGERYADGNYEVRNQILEHFGLEEE